jgi:hypothetical protein
MKSGGPWNLRGLHPQARQAAREAARRSGMSVGEWLNGVIQTDDDQDNEPKGYVEFDRDTDYDRPQYSYDDYDGNMGREPDWQPRDNIVRNRPERGRNRERQQNRDREQYRNSELTRERERNSERVTGREREQSRAREQAREREQSRAREQAREREQNRAREQAREREREQNRAREQAHEREREQNQAREQAREREQSRARERDPGSRREAARTRDDLGELHGRLDKLSNQLERITQREAAQRRLFSGERPAPSELSDAPTPQLTGAPAAPRRVERPPVRNRPAANNGESSVDQAVAEIAARQRVLDGETAVDAPIVAPLAPAPILPVTAEVRPAATIDLGNLEQQLRHITARIEELRPSSNLEQTISAIRTDLAEIARQLNEALPRRAVESLEI